MEQTVKRNINEDAPWSPVDSFDLRDQIRRGKSVDDIAFFLCRRPEEVISKARELGLPIKVTSRSPA